MPTHVPLRASIDSNFPTNGVEFITATIMRGFQNEATDVLGASQYKGLAVPATDPGIQPGPCFFLAFEAGSYPNFSGIVINQGELHVLKYDGVSAPWTSDVIDISGIAGATVVTIPNGGTYVVPVDTFLEAVTITSTTNQTVTIETNVGLGDIADAVSVTSTRPFTSRVDWDTVAGAITLTVTCTTEVTLKIYKR